MNTTNAQKEWVPKNIRKTKANRINRSDRVMGFIRDCIMRVAAKAEGK